MLLSWLSELVHYLFPGDKTPGPGQFTTLVCDRIFIKGADDQVLRIDCDAHGVMVYFPLTSESTAGMILRRKPTGECVLKLSPQVGVKGVTSFDIGMTPTGVPTVTLSDGKNIVSFGVDDVMAWKKANPAPVVPAVVPTAPEVP